MEDYQAMVERCLGRIREDGTIWVRKLTMEQQWAHDAQNHQGGDRPPTLSEEYKRHTMVFDEGALTCFPPEREEELSINLLSRPGCRDWIFGLTVSSKTVLTNLTLDPKLQYRL